jgi:hypothetical protein
MKASELRIDNWIERLFEDESCGVEQCTVRTIWDVHKAETEPSNPKFQFKPIPLTEEWLIKFGFESRIETTYSLGYSRDYKVHSLNGFTYNSIQAAWWYHRLLDKQPEYVHQLQNLYFALTGEELTIKQQNDIFTPEPPM